MISRESTGQQSSAVDRILTVSNVAMCSERCVPTGTKAAMAAFTQPATVPSAGPAAEQRRAHWDDMSRVWRRLGSPLRPCPADIEIMERAVADCASRRDSSSLRALLLGVTPEIADMRWPADAQLLAVDRSPQMVRSVWPGDRPGRRAVCGEWADELSKAGPLGLVIGDACLATLEYPDE